MMGHSEGEDGAERWRELKADEQRRGGIHGQR